VRDIAAMGGHFHRLDVIDGATAPYPMRCELLQKSWTEMSVSVSEQFSPQHGRLAMKHKQYSVEQIVAALKQAELGMPVADLIRQLGISEQTYYRWKRMYAGLESNQVRELKQLQDENARLKKLVAELSLDKAILQDIATKKWPRPR
jgi:putative transposase